eukprot:5569333-Amphidinium_carterae.1
MSARTATMTVTIKEKSACKRMPSAGSPGIADQWRMPTPARRCNKPSLTPRKASRETTVVAQRLVQYPIADQFFVVGVWRHSAKV